MFAIYFGYSGTGQVVNKGKETYKDNICFELIQSALKTEFCILVYLLDRIKLAHKHIEFFEYYELRGLVTIWRLSLHQYCVSFYKILIVYRIYHE